MRVSLRDLNNCADGKQSFVHGKVLDRDDGLLVPNCGTEYSPSCLKARDGRLWFAMRSGLLIVDPDALGTKTNPPPVYIEDLLADGNVVRRRVQLTPGTHNLRIQFTALDLSAPRKVRFRRWLEGYDPGWADVGNERVATYTKVPPGDYTFHVSAVQFGRHLERTGSAFCVQHSTGLVADGLDAIRGSSVVARSFPCLSSRPSPALGAPPGRAGDVRPKPDRFPGSRAPPDCQRVARQPGTDAADYQKPRLYGLKAKASPETMREQLKEISEASTHSIDEVRTIARGLRPYQLDRLGLTSTLEDSAELVTSRGARWSRPGSIPWTDCFPPQTEISIYRIVQEGLNNAVKHASATAVSLTVRREWRGRPNPLVRRRSRLRAQSTGRLWFDGHQRTR